MLRRPNAQEISIVLFGRLFQPLMRTSTMLCTELSTDVGEEIFLTGEQDEAVIWEADRREIGLITIQW
jgi:hypothetical protein